MPNPGENPAQAPAAPEAAPPQPPATGENAAKAAKAAKKTAEAEANAVRQDNAAAEANVSQLSPKTYTPEEIDAVLKKPEYAAALSEFYEKKDEPTLLKAVSDANDKAKIDWALSSAPTEQEKKVLAEKLKENLPTNNEAIAEKVTDGTLNYREAKVCEAILRDAEAAKNKVTAAAEGLGIGVVLEKLIENLSKLFEKLGGMVERFAKSFEKATFKLSSPLGGENKIAVLQKYEKDKSPLTIDAKTNTEIYGAVNGKVIKAEGNTVEIETPNKIRILYENVTPAVQSGAEIKAGETKIGKSVSDAGVAIRLFDTQNQERDPTKYLLK